MAKLKTPLRKSVLIVCFLTFMAATPAFGAAAANSVTSSSIVDGAVKAADLGSGSVKRGKIANGAVNSAKIAERSIVAVDIANGAITSAKIADGSITNADIAAGAAISPAKIAGGAWTGANDGPGSGLDADRLDGLQAADFPQIPKPTTEQIAMLKWYEAGNKCTYAVGGGPSGTAFDGANIWTANAGSGNVTILRAWNM